MEAQAVQARSGIGSAVLTGGFIRVIASPLNAAVEPATLAASRVPLRRSTAPSGNLAFLRKKAEAPRSFVAAESPAMVSSTDLVRMRLRKLQGRRELLRQLWA